MPPSNRTNDPPSTRERILDYLREHHVASAGELSQAWKVTRADIRYHLTVLLEEGLIELVPRSPEQVARRGRPVQIVRLSPHAAPNNLPALCHVLLGAYLNNNETRSEAQLELAKRMAAGFTPTANLTRRLGQAVEFLDRYAYCARWEAGAQGPRILLRTCPYTAILPQHPELCQIDRLFLEQLLHIPLRQIARIDPLTGQPPACIFTPSG